MLPLKSPRQTLLHLYVCTVSIQRWCKLCYSIECYAIFLIHISPSVSLGLRPVLLCRHYLCLYCISILITQLIFAHCHFTLGWVHHVSIGNWQLNARLSPLSPLSDETRHTRWAQYAPVLQLLQGSPNHPMHHRISTFVSSNLCKHPPCLMYCTYNNALLICYHCNSF